jgi:hypothetical protein
VTDHVDITLPQAAERTSALAQTPCFKEPDYFFSLRGVFARAGEDEQIHVAPDSRKDAGKDATRRRRGRIGFAPGDGAGRSFILNTPFWRGRNSGMAILLQALLGSGVARG